MICPCFLFILSTQGVKSINMHATPPDIRPEGSQYVHKFVRNIAHGCVTPNLGTCFSFIGQGTQHNIHFRQMGLARLFKSSDLTFAWTAKPLAQIYRSLASPRLTHPFCICFDSVQILRWGFSGPEAE